MFLRLFTITILVFLVVTAPCVLAQSAEEQKDTPLSKTNVNNMVLIKGCPSGDFYLSKYEVTNKDYCQYVFSHENPGDSLPVVNVSWEEAAAYCKWLSSNTGKNYRLPTESEWEYACRAGSKTDYYWGENMDMKTGDSPITSNYCWYKSNSSDKVHPVGQKLPNTWGLYDMIGNVAEWCSDYHDFYPYLRSICGGSCLDSPWFFRSVILHLAKFDWRYNYIGFRVVMTP
jgi:formylglycine-generating enzyme required for sulfatase activity